MWAPHALQRPNTHSGKSFARSLSLTRRVKTLQVGYTRSLLYKIERCFTKSNTMQQFPPEIFGRIYSHIDDPQTIRSWLTSTTLLSNIARLILYGCLFFSSANKDPVPESMIPLVRSVTLVVYPSRIVPFSLPFMANLEELNVECGVTREVWNFMLNCLKPGQVKRLTISREASGALEDELLLSKFASVFYSLEHLHFEGPFSMLESISHAFTSLTSLMTTHLSSLNLMNLPSTLEDLSILSPDQDVNALTDFGNRDDAPCLRTLEIDLGGLKDIGFLAAQAFRGIEDILIQGRDFVNSHVAEMACFLPHLRRVTFKGTKVNGKGLSNLQHLEELREVVLIETDSVMRGGVAAFLQASPQVKSVSVINCRYFVENCVFSMIEGTRLDSSTDRIPRPLLHRMVKSRNIPPPLQTGLRYCLDTFQPFSLRWDVRRSVAEVRSVGEPEPAQSQSEELMRMRRELDAVKKLLALANADLAQQTLRFKSMHAQNKFLMELLLRKKSFGVKPSEISFSGRFLGEGGYKRWEEGLYVSDSTTLTVAVGVTKPLQTVKEYSMFVEEIRAYRALVHPGVVRAFGGFVQDDDCGVFVSELADGNMSSYVARKEDPGTFVKLDMIGQLVNALEYIHGEGLVHGDLKLPNILFFSPNADTITGPAIADTVTATQDHPLPAPPLPSTPSLIATGTATTISATAGPPSPRPDTPPPNLAAPVSPRPPPTLSPVLKIVDFSTMAPIPEMYGLTTASISHAEGYHSHRTLHVRPPEHGRRVTPMPSADVYGFGFVAASILLWEETFNRAKIFSEIKRRFGEELGEVVEGMLKENVGERWDLASVREALDELL